MSKERELLQRCLDEFEYKGVACNELCIDINKLLAQPEQEGVYQKLLRIEDGIEVEILPSELWQDGYETGKRSVLLSKQPEQEPVAWMYDHQLEVGYDKYTEVNIIETCARNLESNNCINIRPLYLAPPKRKPLSDEEIGAHTPFYYYDTEQKAFTHGVRLAEHQHGIGGGE